MYNNMAAVPTQPSKRTGPTEPPIFPDDFAACEDRSYFERYAVADLCYFLQGQYLYCHTSGILVQIVEAEAYSEEHDPFIHQAMFGSPCAQFKVKAGQLVARFPTQAQGAMTPQTAAASVDPLELYITAGRDEYCGDVVRLLSFKPVEGLAQLEARLGLDNVEGMVIGKEDIAKALGAAGNVLDWDANPFLYESEGVQLFFLRQPLPQKNVERGPLHLDKTRVGSNLPGQNKFNCFSFVIDADIQQRIS